MRTAGIVEVAPGWWKPIERCSERDKIRASSLVAQASEMIAEIKLLLAELQASRGADVALPEWASVELRAWLRPGGWDGVPSIVTVRRVHDDLKRWAGELLLSAGAGVTGG